jgi:hypothetical protein
MDLKHLRAYITGTVDQELLLRNEYLSKIPRKLFSRNVRTGRIRGAPRRSSLRAMPHGRSPTVRSLSGQADPLAILISSLLVWPCAMG